MTPPTKVGTTALILAPLVVIARGIGFLVPILIADRFGVTTVTDAFFYALAWPLVVMVVVANAMATVVTPILAEIEAESDGDPAPFGAFVGSIAAATALLALAVGSVLLVALPPSLPLATAFDAPTRGWTLAFVAELVPFMVFMGASTILRAACEVRGSFVPVALAPIPRASVTMAALVLLPAVVGDHALALAMVLGAAVELVYVSAVLARTGVVPTQLRPRLDPRVRRTARDVLPVLGGQALVALHLVVDRSFAGSLEPGDVSLLEYADRVRLIPQTLVEGSLLPVAFATWSHQAARGEIDRYAAQLDQSLRWLAAWAAPPLAGLYIGRVVLVGLLFERGAFTPTHTQAVADVFGWYAPGLWAMFLGALAMRANVVEYRLSLVLWLGALSLALKVAFNAALVGPLGLQGLPLSSTLGWFVIPACFLFAIRGTLARAARPAQWGAVFAIAAASAGVALVTPTPTSLLDPGLWIAAVVCFGLLGAAVLSTRPPSD